MATPTYDLLDSATAPSDITSLTFSGIDQSYADAIIVVSIPSGTSAGQIYFRVNGDSAYDTYANFELYGDGTSGDSNKSLINNAGYVDYSKYTIRAGQGSMMILQAFDYSATNKFKYFLFRGGASDEATTASALWYKSSNAMTSITLTTSPGTFPSGTTFDLYGVIA